MGSKSFGEYLIALSLGVPLAASAAGDPAAGQGIYQSICASCHGPSAAANFNGILSAAGSPTALRAAWSRQPLMNFLLTTLSPTDTDNIAAYLAQVAGGSDDSGGGVGGGGGGGVGGGPTPTAIVVEFYNATLDHYFISAIQGETDVLDSGRFAGWARTGKTFKAYAKASDAPADASPVCRFYIPPAQGDSHFYSASPDECAAAQRLFPTFELESSAVMYIQLPDRDSGSCVAGTQPVYRVWNARRDSNHRYTTDIALRDQMVARGYVAEGYGPFATIMCAPL